MEYCGGYFVLLKESVDQSIYLKRLQSQGYSIEKLISLDKNVGGVFPDLYSVWENSSNLIDPILTKEILSSVLVPNVFENLKIATKAYIELHHQRKEVNIIGIELDEKYIVEFNENRFTDNDENGEGVVLCLNKQKKAEKTGVVIGYDIVGYELGGHFLSFLGNDLLGDYKSYISDLPINKYGLISDKETAEKLATFTNKVLISEVGAEDLLWLPWKIILYI